MPLISYATSYNRTTVNSHCLCAYCLERYDCTIFDYLLLLFLQEDTTKINKETLNGVQIVDFIQLEHSLERQRKKNGLRQFYAYVFFSQFRKISLFPFSRVPFRSNFNLIHYDYYYHLVCVVVTRFEMFYLFEIGVSLLKYSPVSIINNRCLL